MADRMHSFCNDTLEATLPDFYETVAEDLIDFCGQGGSRIWVDLGCGPGAVGLALLGQLAGGTMVLMDPNAGFLQHALDTAQKKGHLSRATAVSGLAESMPLSDRSVDVVISRGSLFFWHDRVQGLREVWRILRPGGRAMLGGGLGSGYPDWARREFIRRQRESQRSKGSDAMGKFRDARSPDTFRRLALEVGLPEFEIVGEGGQEADAPDTGVGIWLRFTKE